MAGIQCTVPGLIVPFRQPSSMSCWAAMFTMMYSWKNQVSTAIERAIATLGPTYLKCFRDKHRAADRGKPPARRGCGLVAEPLMNPSIEG
jgi:Papain-like cysteine protease AvrRpt2